jgi:hypothetical protein
MLLILSVRRISTVLFLKFVLMVTFTSQEWSLRIGLYAPKLIVSNNLAAIDKDVGVLNTAVQCTRMKRCDILLRKPLAYIAYSQLCQFCISEVSAA